jgi:hypothetical protein
MRSGSAQGAHSGCPPNLQVGKKYDSIIRMNGRAGNKKKVVLFFLIFRQRIIPSLSRELTDN